MNTIFETMNKIFEANENSALGAKDKEFANFVANGCVTAKLELKQLPYNNVSAIITL